MRLQAIFIILGLLLTTTASPSDLIFDVGNDTSLPWEWSQNNSFSGPEATHDFSAKLSQIISSDCNCNGCVVDGPYCVIPFRFRSAYPGEMTVSDIGIVYESIRVMYNVTYGEAFKISDGCEWHIQHPNGLYIAKIPPSYPGSDICYYTAGSSSLIETEDALVDSMYRLLNKTLDSNQDGVIDVDFNEATMSFQTHGMINVQSLWGPAVVKLIVWI